MTSVHRKSNGNSTSAASPHGKKKLMRWMRTAKQELMESSLTWYFDTSEEQIKEYMEKQAEKKRAEKEHKAREIESRKELNAKLKARREKEKRARERREAREREAQRLAQLGKTTRNMQIMIESLQEEYNQRKARFRRSRKRQLRKAEPAKQQAPKVDRVRWQAVDTKPRKRTAWGSVQSTEITCNKPNQNHYFHRRRSKRKTVSFRASPLPSARSLPSLE